MTLHPDFPTSQHDVLDHDFVYVDQESFEKYRPKSFAQLMEGFRGYKFG